MHHKKRKLHKLHSIPIGLCNKVNRNRLYLVSYSIPLSCMVVLLLGLGIMFNPDYFVSQKSYAIEAGETGAESSNNMARVAPAPTIALNVTSDTSDGYSNTVAGQVTTSPGAGTAYRSHKVKITGSNIMSYDLKISGPTNLTPSNGANTVVSGADGKTGAEMSTSNANIWGYAWGEDSEAVEEMAYNTVSNANDGTTLTCDNPSASYEVDCERKLVFGANFNTEANPGTYTATVNLALTATPAVITYTLNYNANGGTNAPTTQTVDSASSSVQFVISGQGSMTKSGYNFLGWSASSSATAADANYAPGKTMILQRDNPSSTLYAVWKVIGAKWSNGLDSGITNMQDIKSGFCVSSLPVGTTIKLKDNRDQQEYTIAKLKDNKCWMQQDLRLGGSTAVNLTPSNTNIANNWTLPAIASSWSNTDNYSIVQTVVSTSFQSNVYSWCAATANTCGEASTDNTNVSGSICPKGWHLPSGGSVGADSEFYKLTNGLSKSAVVQLPYLFSVTGYGYSASLAAAGGDPFLSGYWSRTSRSGSLAYALGFRESGVFPGTDTMARSSGSFVRCVANY